MNEKQLECSGYPLTVGSVHGIRQWRVDRLGRLRGISYDSVWRPGENVAECRRSESLWATGGLVTFHSLVWNTGVPVALDPQPKPPEPKKPKTCDGMADDCACGFYAYHDGDADYARKAHDVVTGVIEGYGKTTVGTRGFRCEKAKIVALSLRFDGGGKRRPAADVARRIARNYPDVAIFRTVAEMVTEFPPDPSLEPTPETDPEFWERKS